MPSTSQRHKQLCDGRLLIQSAMLLLIKTLRTDRGVRFLHTQAHNLDDTARGLCRMVATSTHSPAVCKRCSCSPTSHQESVLFLSLVFAYLMGIKHHIVALISISLVINEPENLLMYLLALAGSHSLPVF